MELLRAVNRIITRLGENPVDTVDVKHPTVSIALQHLTSVNTELQLPGWWFNTYEVELQPDIDGKVLVPKGTLSWTPKEKGTHLVRRSIVCSKTGEDKWDKPIKGRIQVEVDFPDTPMSFAHWVVAEASVKAYLADYGIDDLVQIWMTDAAKAQQQVHVEHLQNMRYTTRNTARARRLYASIWR